MNKNYDFPAIITASALMGIFTLKIIEFNLSYATLPESVILFLHNRGDDIALIVYVLGSFIVGYYINKD